MDNGSPPTKRMRTDDEEEEVTAASTLSQILQKVNVLVANQDQLIADNASFATQVKALTAQVKSLKSSLDTANQQLATIHNGQQRLNRVFREPSDQAGVQMAALDSETVASTASVPALPVTLKDEHHANPSQGEQTPCKNLKGSDNNLYLSDILISLRNTGVINIENISKSTYPRDIVRHSGNTSYIRYCLELVEFVAASNPVLADCIRSLADTTNDNPESIRSVADVLSNACAEKIEEFDGKRVRKKTAIGFGSRIRDYKKKIAHAMAVGNADSAGLTAENVRLVEREEFDSLQAGVEAEEI